MSQVALGEGTVLYEKVESFARITLNRPEVLNAINQQVLAGLKEALEQAEADEEVRAVILTGAGRSFCSGGDLSARARGPVTEAPASPPPSPTVNAGDVYTAIWDLSKPVIAAVAGHAVGQGSELAGICDITIAAEDAKMGEIQIRHGFGMPVLITPYILGLKRAKEMILTGEQINAHEALSIGWVNRVVPREKLQEEAEAMARKIASLPRNAVRQDKRLINRSFELRGIRAAINHSRDAAFADLAPGGMRDPEGEARFRVLQERGWEAFIRERDALYRKKEGEG